MSTQTSRSPYPPAVRPEEKGLTAEVGVGELPVCPESSSPFICLRRMSEVDVFLMTIPHGLVHSLHSPMIVYGITIVYGIVHSIWYCESEPQQRRQVVYS